MPPITDESLINNHGLHAVSAAYLLVLGRRALNAYASDRGQDLSLLAPLLIDAVGAWVDANGGNRADVSAVAAALDDRMLHEDYATKPQINAPSVAPWFAQNPVAH